MPSEKRIILGLIGLSFIAVLVQSAITARGPLPGASGDAAPVVSTESRKVSSTSTTAGNSSVLNDADDRAAAENSRLKTELEWTFGGKAQRGWQIYVPLISHLIRTDADENSREFAQALARWQKSAGRRADGVLDKETLAAMIQTWQSRRIKDRAYPSADNLVTLAPAEFYDSSRPEELRKVERQAYAAYKRMVAAAVSDSSTGLAGTRNGELASSEQFLKIVSAFRSKEYQDRLRQQSPEAGRAGLAVNSPHFTGRALDLYVGGDPVSTKDANRLVQIRTRVYRWLVKNAEKFGFVPYFYEPWHWEYRPA